MGNMGSDEDIDALAHQVRGMSNNGGHYNSSNCVAHNVVMSFIDWQIIECY